MEISGNPWICTHPHYQSNVHWDIDFQCSQKTSVQVGHTRMIVRVKPASGSAIRYPEFSESVLTSSGNAHGHSTIGLAVDERGFPTDARIAIDSDLVHVLIDARHNHGCNLSVYNKKSTNIDMQ